MDNAYKMNYLNNTHLQLLCRFGTGATATARRAVGMAATVVRPPRVSHSHSGAAAKRRGWGRNGPGSMREDQAGPIEIQDGKKYI